MANFKRSEIHHICLDRQGVYRVYYDSGRSALYTSDLPQTVQVFLTEHPFLFYRLKNGLDLCTHKIGRDWQPATREEGRI